MKALDVVNVPICCLKTEWSLPIYNPQFSIYHKLSYED